MEPINQYLPAVIVGAFLGIMLTLQIVRAVGGSMRNNDMRRSYPGRHGHYRGGGSGTALLFVALFTGVIAFAAYYLLNEKNVTPLSEEFDIKLPDTEEMYKGSLEENLPEEPEDSGRTINQSPGRDHLINRPRDEVRQYYEEQSEDVVFASTVSNNQSRGDPREQPSTQEQSGHHYIQIAAGQNWKWTVGEAKKYQSRLNSTVWIGVGNESAPYAYKVLVGPFPSEGEAYAANKNFHNKGHVKNALREELIVMSLSTL